MFQATRFMGNIKAVFTSLFLLCSLAGYSKDKLNFQMIYVKGGSFYMGSDDPHYRNEKYDNERPVHRVFISSYYIGKYEVTHAQWRAIMGIYPMAYNGVDYGNKNCDDCPVVKVSYDEVQEYIRRLNIKTGKHYRLPTETEWEYAGRGGKYTQNFKYCGSNNINEVAYYGKRNGTTHVVGQKKQNELSIFDMSGNVMEWCSDWYGEQYYLGTIDSLDPRGPVKGSEHIVRGGSFYDEEDVCRIVNRAHYVPKTSMWNLGFRLAMDAENTTIITTTTTTTTTVLGNGSTVTDSVVMDSTVIK